MKPDSTTYCGLRRLETLSSTDRPSVTTKVEVSVDGRPLEPEPSQKIRNHSPNGFNWGYCGSGPAQLALAICLDFLGDSLRAQSVYQELKLCLIARIPQEEDWKISGRQIRETIQQIELNKSRIGYGQPEVA